MTGRQHWEFVATIRVLLTVTAISLAVPIQAQVPHYEVDPFWPKLPLGDGWITGGLGGMCIDDRDHVYVLNRQNVVPADLNAANLAPPVIEFDPDGRVVRGWGTSEQLGARLHDCHIDADHNIWIVAAATGVIQKYSHDGSERLLQIGESNKYDSSDGTRQGRPMNSNHPQFFLPASVDVDPENGDVYVADGETPEGNSRIAVLTRNGQFLRQWRLHRTEQEDGIVPLPHCLRLSNDGLVYVCDRRGDRIQVFDRQGTFIRNIDVPWPTNAPQENRRSETRGTAVVIAFSADSAQRHLFVINQNSVMIDILDRQTGTVVGNFGGGPGRYLGQFTLPHGIAVDSKGDVYVAEQEGRRIQKFRLVKP